MKIRDVHDTRGFDILRSPQWIFPSSGEFMDSAGEGHYPLEHRNLSPMEDLGFDTY